MCRKLVYLVCFVLVLELVGGASAFQIVDDFESGNLDAWEIIGGDDFYSIGPDPTNPDNNCLVIVPHDATDAYARTPMGVPAGASETLFYRFMYEIGDGGGTVNLHVGPSDPDASAWGDFYGLARFDSNADPANVPDMDLRDGGAYSALVYEDFEPLRWYDVLMDINTVTRTYDLYIDEELVYQNAAFRSDHSPADLEYIVIRTTVWSGKFENATVYVDNIVTGGILTDIRELAYGPHPRHEAMDVPPDVVLTWTPGEFANTHDVYFGTVFDDVNDASRTNPLSVLVSQNQEPNSYSPAEILQWNQTYYWRVDEVNEVDPNSPWKGNVWSFTTANIDLVGVVDDFESYDDDVEARTTIYDTWIDGMTNNSGSTVGYWEAPFCEQKIVHGGLQSMPLEYNNTIEPYYSEAVRTWLDPRNWIDQGAQTLRLWYQGRAASGSLTFDAAAGTYTMTGAGSNIWYAADEFHFAPKQLTGDGSISLRVDNIVPSTHGDPRLGVMIRDTLDADARNATLFVEPDPRTRLTHRFQPGGDTATAVATAEGETPLPTWIRLTREGFTFKAERSTDGVAWRALTDDPAASSVNIAMTDPVYVGLVVCSHVAGQFAEATYSNVRTVGDVVPAGPFTTSQDIGIASNAPAQLYVAVEDTAGRVAIANHPDGPAAVTVTTWTPWDIPLADFTDVDLAAVKKMYIGVGDRNSPVPDGIGMLYIDDIGLGLKREAPVVPPEDPGTENLVAYYAFENNAQDGSGNGHDGVAVNDALIDGALVLDGNQQYVEVADDPAFDLTDAFTITAFVTLDAANDRRAVITKEHAPNESRGWNCWIQDGEPRMQLMDGDKWAETGDVGQSKLTVTSGATLEAGRQYHLAFVYNSAGPEQIYVDGVLQVSENVVSGHLHVNEQPVRIGAYIWDEAGYHKYLAGSIDEVRVYSRVLEQAEIAALMNGN
jgi:hypothetical protein